MILVQKDVIIRSSLKNSSVSFLGNIIGIIITLFTAGYSIRILGEEIAGFIMLVQSILGFSAGLFNFGLGPAIIKEISESSIIENNKKINESISASTFINILLGFGVAILFSLVSHQIFVWSKLKFSLQNQAEWSIYLYAATFAINFSINSFQAIPAALQKYEYVSIFSVFQILSGGLVQVLILIFVPSLVNFALGMLLVTLVQAAISLIITKKLLGKISMPKWDFIVIKRLFKFSSYIIGTQLGYVARDYVDKWILNGLQGSIALPGFITSQTILNRVRSFISSIFHFIFPMFSSNSQVLEKDKLFAIYDKLQWAVALIGTFCFGGIAINASWILSLWIGKSFASRYTLILQMACLQGIFSIFSIVPHFSSLGLNKPINILIESLLSAVLVIVMATIFLPLYGVMGAAMAQLITYLIVIIAFLIVFKKNVFPEYKILKVLNPIFPSLILSIGAFLLIFFMSNNLDFQQFTVINFCLVNSFYAILFVCIIGSEKIFVLKSDRLAVVSYSISLTKNLILSRIRNA